MIADIICRPAMILSAIVLVDYYTVYNPLSLRYHHLLYYLRDSTDDDGKIDDNPPFLSPLPLPVLQQLTSFIKNVRRPILHFWLRLSRTLLFHDDNQHQAAVGAPLPLQFHPKWLSHFIRRPHMGAYPQYQPPDLIFVNLSERVHRCVLPYFPTLIQKYIKTLLHFLFLAYI